jgi:phage-related protein (TIGR01555 family)
MSKNSRSRAKQRVADQKHATADSFVNLVSRLGYGARNQESRGTYLPNLLTKNRMLLEWMYRGNWVVGRAIDTVADDMTRAGIAIEGGIDPARIREIQADMISMGVWKKLNELLKWGRLYGGAIAVIDIAGQDASTPLDISTVGRGQFTGLKVYDRWQLQPDLTRLVKSGPDAETPESYTLISNLATGQLSGTVFHHTRCVRNVGIELPLWQSITEQYWGESVLERCLDRLNFYNSLVASIAALMNHAHLRTVRVDKLREMLSMGGPMKDAIFEMFALMAELQTINGITLLDKNDEFQSTNYTFSGIADAKRALAEEISGALEIPLVVLLGQSPSGFSTGDTDMAIYHEGINSKQNAQLRRGTTTILEVMHQSKYGQPAPADFDFKFTPLKQLSAKEKAEIAGLTATAVLAAHDAALCTTSAAMKELKQSSAETGIFSNISDADIEAAEIEPPQPEPPLDAEPQDSAPTQPQAGSPLLDRIMKKLGIGA